MPIPNKTQLLDFIIWLNNETLIEILAEPEFYVNRYIDEKTTLCKAPKGFICNVKDNGFCKLPTICIYQKKQTLKDF